MMVMPKMKRTVTEAPADGAYWRSDDGTRRIFHGKCEEIAPRLEARSYQLVFADPPFNIDRDYDQYRDRLPKDRYVAWTNDWVREMTRLLTIDGSMVVAIGDDHAADVKLALDRAGLKMRNWIIWHYTFGVHCETKFGRDHTHLLYYVRNEKRLIFNSDAIRVESERQRLGDKRANTKGRVPGDVFKTHYETEESFEKDVWTVPRLVGNARERTSHTCQMPESILERLILALTNEGDSVLDPFAGSGTTMAVASRLGRRCDTIELSESYINDIIVPRVKSVR